MKKNRVLKNVAAWLLTGVLLTGEFCGTGLRAYAAGEGGQEETTADGELSGPGEDAGAEAEEQAEWEASVTEADAEADAEETEDTEDADAGSEAAEEAIEAEEETDVPAEEEENALSEGAEPETARDEAEEESAAEADKEGPSELLIWNGTKMVDVLAEGNSYGKLGNGAYFYGNGILLLAGAKITDTVLKPAPAAIDCNGKLIIQLIGVCSVDIRGTGSKETGEIKVTGDLLIMNADENGLKTVPAEMLKNETFHKELAELLKDGGRLTVGGSADNGNGGYGIDCDGELSIRGAAGSDTPFGEKIGKGDLIGKLDKPGLTLTVHGPKSSAAGCENSSVGIKAKSIDIRNAAVKAYGEESNAISYGVYAQGGGIDVLSGSLDAKSAACGMNGFTDESIRSSAVFSSGDINIGTAAAVTAVSSGEDANDHVAVWSYNGDVNVNGTLSAGAEGETGHQIAVLSTKTKDSEPVGKISLSGNYIAIPNDGTTGRIGVTKRVAVTDRNGNAAAEAEIAKGRNYDLWIGGIRVNDKNRSDLSEAVSGTDVTAKFTPSSNTLTLKNVTGINGTAYEDDGMVCKISSAIPVLNLRGDLEAVYDDSSAKKSVFINAASLNIDGEFSISGKLDCGIQAASGLTVDGSGTVLAVDVQKEGSVAIESGNGYDQKDGAVALKGKKRGLYNTGGAVTFEGGSFEADGDVSAVAGTAGTSIVLGEGMVTAEGVSVGTLEEDISGEKDIVTFVSGGEALTEVKVKPEVPVQPLTVIQADLVYGEVCQAFTATPELSGATDTVSYNGYIGFDHAEKYGPSEEAPTLPGEYEVVVTRKKDDEIYRGSAEFVIAKKPVTVTVTAQDRPYIADHAEVNLTAGPVNGIVGDDDVTADVSSATALMTDDKAGDNKAVTIDGVTLGGAQADRYTLEAQPAGVTVNIEKAEWIECSALVTDVSAGDGGTISVAYNLAPGASYGIPAVSEGEEQLAEAPYIDYELNLHFSVKADVEKVDVKIAVPVAGGENYKDYTLTVTLSGESEVKNTVSFNMMGHGVQIDPVQVVSGSMVYRPVDPAEEGYSFEGWYTDEGLTEEYVFSLPVRSDMTLYAKWFKKDVIPVDGHSALDPVPADLDSCTELYLVKGQKFTIGSGWVIEDKKTAGKYVSINSKGLLKAKKETTSSVQVTISNSGLGRSVKIFVSKPVIDRRASKLKLNAGASGNIVLKGYDAEHQEVYWYSAKPDVATVDEEGNVKAVAKGSSKITAYINGSAYSCTVSVKEPETAPVRTLHINTNDKATVSIKGMDGWTGSYDGVARADKKAKKKIISLEHSDTTGAVTFNTMAKGETYSIVAYVEDITLAAADGLKEEKACRYTLNIKEGESVSLCFKDVEQDVVFKSSKPEIAFIDEDGNVEARTEGKAKFTTKINGKTVTVNVVVSK